MKLDHVMMQRGGKTICKDGDKIYKIFDQGYSKADILNEALNQARVEETGLKMNHVQAVTHLEDGRWVIISDYIEGETLQELMDKNPDKMDEYLELFVDLQLSVHAKRAPYLNKLKDKMNLKISQAQLDATTRYELHTRLEGMKKHTKVCHGDFNPTNVIIAKDGTPYVIDWAHATQGNASADVARTYLLFCLEGKEEIAKKYMALFCQKSDTAMQYVQKWLPIVAASQSVKGKEEERQFLLRWADVVDYE
ncbi:MAG: phosphotransferase [Clostridia bacterium]|nr:phosphotransferase [Clostridia bacterium]